MKLTESEKEEILRQRRRHKNAIAHEKLREEFDEKSKSATSSVRLVVPYIANNHIYGVKYTVCDNDTVQEMRGHYNYGLHLCCMRGSTKSWWEKALRGRSKNRYETEPKEDFDFSRTRFLNPVIFNPFEIDDWRSCETNNGPKFMRSHIGMFGQIEKQDGSWNEAKAAFETAEASWFKITCGGLRERFRNLQKRTSINYWGKPDELWALLIAMGRIVEKKDTAAAIEKSILRRVRKLGANLGEGTLNFFRMHAGAAAISEALNQNKPKQTK